MKYFIACRLQKPPVSFFIDNLEAGSSYRIILFSANAKGRSEPTIIDEITFKGVAKYTGNLWQGDRRIHSFRRIILFGNNLEISTNKTSARKKYCLNFFILQTVWSVSKYNILGVFYV